jgi:putative salt-induced outer membrane protein YdiY
VLFALLPSLMAGETNAAPSETELTTTNTAAQPTPSSEPTEQRIAIQLPPKWSGPDTSDGFDWVELTSGEWLKGEIKTMYDDTLEFDSDKLDLLELDWEDVRQVVTERTQTVRNESKEEYAGALHIDEDRVQVTDAAGETSEFERSELLGIVEGAPKEINYWSFKLGAGLTIQSGNTKQSDLNINARIQRRTAGNRLTLDYLGIVTETDDVETANNHRLNGSFDWFVTRKLFLRPVFGTYYKDRFQNIEHQGTIGFGIGYHLVDNSKTEWDVFAGPAFQYTKFVSVQPGESLEASTPAFVAGTEWESELTKWMDANAGYTLSLLNERSGTYTHHATAGLEIELTSILDLDFSIVWDRIQTPQQRADGSTPLQDDFRVLVGVSLDI